MNIVGLSTGLACIMVLAVVSYQFLGADANMREIDQMYYLKTKAPDGSEFSMTTYPLLGEIVKKCPEVEAASHIQQWYYPWLKYGNKEFQETTTFVDTGYFDVFRFPFKYGDPSTALRDKFSIVLSEEIAEKFFGNGNPVGKIIVADDSLQLMVKGVLEHVPSNSTVRPVVLIPTAILASDAGFRSSAGWYNTFASNYLRIRKGSDAKTLNAKIEEIVNLNYAPEHKGNKVIAVPFKKITEEGAAITGVIVRGAVTAGIFILLIVLVNLVNLNVAGMYSRSKEVAVRQMIGGNKRNIVFQFCIENGLIVGISIVLSWLIFSLLLLPAVSAIIKDNFGEIEIGLANDYPLIILFGGLCIFFTIIAAAVPAQRLTAIRVTDAVKGKLNSGSYRSSGVRNIFIAVQFALAITIICISVIFSRQIAFMKTSSLGFNKENVAVINLDMAFRDPVSAGTRFESIINELKKNPHVRAVSTNRVIPTQYDQSYNGFYDPVTNVEVSLRQAPADAGYINVYKIPLVQGRNFDDRLGASQKNAVHINRTAMEAFGWKNAVGKQIKARGEDETYTVVGVLEDFHYQDLQNCIQPIIHGYNGKLSLNNRFLSIRTDAGYVKPVVAQLEQQFKTMPSRRGFSYELMSDKVDKQYTLLEGVLKVTNGIALLTIVIACMGMFGLIALFAKQRVKEIGIRKVLGASVAAIIRLLSKDFLLLVGVAILVATPVAWYVMTRWLRDFAYRIDIQWWMFAIAGGVALMIAALTISLQVVKAALANPVTSLRTE